MAAPARGYVVGRTEDVHKFYHFGQPIGAPGQFGHAVRARHIASGEERAVKVISKARFTRAADRDFHFQQLRAEIEVMKRMNHPNIIKFFEVFEDESELCIVMELCSGGELFDRIKETGQYSEANAAAVLRQMTEGVRYMHSRKIAHCDLKPDNFLFSNRTPAACIKIIDFGMSKFVKRRKYFKSLCGTPYYVAPEVITGHYNHHSDMWSLGVVMFVMLFGYPPFYADPDPAGGDSSADDKIFEMVCKGFKPVTMEGYGPHFPAAIPASDSAKDLIAKLLTLDIAKRLTAQEAIEHPWLQGKTATSVPILPTVIRNLKQFSASTQFKNRVLCLMVDQLSDQEIAEMKRTFQAMDLDGDGTITIDELKIAMRQMGQDADRKEVERLVQMADVDGDGKLSYEELLLTAVNRKLLGKEERLLNTFKRLDVDGDGKITRDEIMKVLGEDSEMARALIKEADIDGDGTINYEEFTTVWGDSQLADTSEVLPRSPSQEAKRS